MKKALIGICVLASSILFMPSAESALITTNLLQNPGFETYVVNDFTNWSEGGSVYRDPLSYSGSSSARIGVPGGSLYQPFTLPADVDTLLFGAYFRIFTNSLDSNWDQAQINMQVSGLPDTTIGGSISNFNTGLFTYNASLGGYLTDWFLIYGSVNVSSIGEVNSAININLQNNSDPLTKLFVDDAFAGAALVPEPSTMLLLGSGLVGLAGYGRRRFKK